MIKEYIAYLKDNPQGYWFKAKLYGWGWAPAKWQGWAVIGVYVLILIGIFRRIDALSHSASDTLIGIFVPFVIITLILIFICYKKGERPRWQWGLPEKYKK